MKSVEDCRTMTAPTTATPTNQSLRQKLPRRAEDDVLTCRPLPGATPAEPVEIHSDAFSTAAGRGRIRPAKLADGHTAHKDHCGAVGTFCCKDPGPGQEK